MRLIPIFVSVTKSEAIAILTGCKWLDQVCRTIFKHEWEDGRQTLLLKMLEQPEETFTPIRDLRFYCIRVAQNLKYDKCRQAKNNIILELPAEIEHIETNDKERIFHQKESIINGLNWYDRTIFKLHESGISGREISRYTGIHRNEISKVITKVKKQIASNVEYYE